MIRDRLFRVLFVAFALIWSTLAGAHGPTPQKARENIHIDAPPAEVWKLVGDISALSDWQPQLAAVHPSEGNDAIVDETGAERVLVFADGGGEITESIDEYAPERHYLGYRLLKEDPSVFPVSFYTATIEITEAAGGSDVEWIARFYRGDTGNFPKEGQTDEAAQKAIHVFFKAGLETLKTKVEDR